MGRIPCPGPCLHFSTHATPFPPGGRRLALTSLLGFLTVLSYSIASSFGGSVSCSPARCSQSVCWGGEGHPLRRAPHPSHSSEAHIASQPPAAGPVDALIPGGGWTPMFCCISKWYEHQFQSPSQILATEFPPQGKFLDGL